MLNTNTSEYKHVPAMMAQWANQVDLLRWPVWKTHYTRTHETSQSSSACDDPPTLSRVGVSECVSFSFPPFSFCFLDVLLWSWTFYQLMKPHNYRWTDREKNCLWSRGLNENPFHVPLLTAYVSALSLPVLTSKRRQLYRRADICQAHVCVSIYTLSIIQAHLSHHWLFCW